MTDELMQLDEIKKQSADVLYGGASVTAAKIQEIESSIAELRAMIENLLLEG